MGWLSQISQVLQKYSGAQDQPTAHQDFDQVAQAAPPAVLAGGISEAFRSNQTPAFPQMVSQMFSQSNGEQKAGLLNQLIATLGPGALSQVSAGGGLGSLAGLLRGGQPVTPEAAQNISPQEVEQAATHAQSANPSIIDTVSGFYAQHPTLVKTLGVTALSIAMSKMYHQ